MAVKYYAGSPVSGKKMDGFTFVFEAIEAVSGTWQGVFKSEDIAEIAALSKLKSEGAVKEISEETYNDLLKKKAVRQAISPNLNAASEQQAVGHADALPPVGGRWRAHPPVPGHRRRAGRVVAAAGLPPCCDPVLRRVRGIRRRRPQVSRESSEP